MLLVLRRDALNAHLVLACQQILYALDRRLRDIDLPELARDRQLVLHAVEGGESALCPKLIEPAQVFETLVHRREA